MTLPPVSLGGCLHADEVSVAAYQAGKSHTSPYLNIGLLRSFPDGSWTSPDFTGLGRLGETSLSMVTYMPGN